MKKIILLLVVSVLLFSCRTKHVVATKLKKTEKTETSKTIEETKNEVSETLSKQTETIEKTDLSKIDNSHIDIEAETDFDKPFEFHEVENGNIKKTITVTGKAKVSIKTNSENIKVAESSDSKTTSENKQQNTSDSNVKSDTKQSSESVKKGKSKDLKVTDTSTGIYITFTVIGIFALLLFFIFLYFKKNKK